MCTECMKCMCELNHSSCADWTIVRVKSESLFACRQDDVHV